MTRQRTTLIALAALIAGIGASQLGSAQADSSSTGASGTTGATGATATTSSGTIIVNGSDVVTLPSGTDQSTVQSNYQTALGNALTNAGQKATFIANQIGATLGPIANVTESSGSGSLCAGPILYAPGVKSQSTPSSRRKVKHGPMIRAMIDPVGSCSVEADVTVTYSMTPA